jgi:hypothetical protein
MKELAPSWQDHRMAYDCDFLGDRQLPIWSKVDVFLMGLLATPVAYGLDWYEMLRLTGAPVMSA